jgi:hypothetical protein
LKIGVSHSGYIANKVATDLANLSFAKLTKGLDIVVAEIETLILDDLKVEHSLEERVRDMMEDYEDEIEHDYYNIDERELFKMIKKKLASQHNFLMSYDDRFNNLSHKILAILLQKKLLEFRVNDIQIKSLIFKSIENYIEERFAIEDKVIDKMRKYKRRLTAGTDEYDIMFQKLYEIELKSKGGL